MLVARQYGQPLAEKVRAEIAREAVVASLFSSLDFEAY